MNRQLLASLGVVAFLTPLQAQAPAAPERFRTDEIRVAEVEVRAGASMQFPSTGILRRGARVVIRGNAGNDFLEIVPPQGSSSWIPKAVVEPFGPVSGGRQAFRVVGSGGDPDVPVLPGSVETNGPLQVDSKQKIARGEQGYIRGKAQKPAWDIREWYPIDPLPRESRFIPRSAVMDAPLGGGSVAADKPAVGGAMPVGRQTTEELLRQAEQAEASGNIELAVKLYNQVAARESARDFNLANRCATKVYELTRTRRPAVNATLTGRSNDMGTTAGSTPTGPAEPPLPGSPTARMATQPASGLRSTGLGWLRKTGFQIDNKPGYALIDSNRRVIWYVIAEPGVNLDPYVERWVELFGTAEVRGDVRGADYMRVSRVNQVR